MSSPHPNSKRCLVVNADDLAICESTNDAIRAAHENGVLTSTSVLANGPAFEHALNSVLAQCPDLAVGLHLNLTTGRCLSRPAELPLLVDSGGRFRHGFFGLRRLLQRHGQAAAEQIDLEMRSQLQRLDDAGVAIDHINSHRHVHMLPQIFERVARLGAESECVVRISDEPFSLRISRHPAFALSAVVNFPKRMILTRLAGRCRQIANERNTPAVFGILSSGKVTAPVFTAMVDMWTEGPAELITHPGGASPLLSSELSPGDRAFHESPNRHRELQALTAPATRRLLENAGISLHSFRDLSAAAGPCLSTS